MNLGSRLSFIASLVRKGSRIADIGTDHAYLPVWLVEQGCCPSAIASDIHKGPTDRAKETVKEYNMTDKISVRFGNGLSTVQPYEIDDIIIAGMGGETIASILSAAPWTKNSFYHFILQPMTKTEFLREYLLKNGFSLLEEHITTEADHLYIILCAVYNPEKAGIQLNDPAVFFRGVLKKEEGHIYFEKLFKRLELVIDAQRKVGNFTEAERLKQIAAEILK